MKITIAHLYYDLLNLYGENGNIKILKQQLENQGINVTIKFLTIDDTLNFKDYDLVYIGMGTEENQLIALKHLRKYKNDVKEAIENNKFFLITGNSIELFGKSILAKNKQTHKCLNIFNYEAKQEDFKIVDEALFSCPFIKKYILGFQNQRSVITDSEYPMFRVLKGTGSYPNSTTEGVHYKNFYGTYLVGPFLIRNPEFTRYFIRKFISTINIKYPIKKINLVLENNAYNDFLEKHYKEFIQN